MFWATKGPRPDTTSYSKWAQARDTNTWIQNRPPFLWAVTLASSHKLAPCPQRSELFTKQHFLIPHSPAPMADQWHLVQYFIKSSWKLTVQSMRKLPSLSHINYLQGCLGATVRPICTETFMAAHFPHIPDAGSISLPPSLPPMVNTGTSKKESFSPEKLTEVYNARFLYFALIIQEFNVASSLRSMSFLVLL